MTTLSIRLKDRTAKQLARLSETGNKTAEDLLSEYAEQLVGLISIRDIAERNAEKLRQAGYTTEEEVQEMIHAEIKAYRAEKAKDRDAASSS
ncbi:MAG: hypothetical protein Rubg2KO_14980 [Rubricoccaceae bacterium]